MATSIGTVLASLAFMFTGGLIWIWVTLRLHGRVQRKATANATAVVVTIQLLAVPFVCARVQWPAGLLLSAAWTAITLSVVLALRSSTSQTGS